MTRKGLILSLYKDYPYLSEYYRIKEVPKDWTATGRKRMLTKIYQS